MSKNFLALFCFFTFSNSAISGPKLNVQNGSPVSELEPKTVLENAALPKVEIEPAKLEEGNQGSSAGKFSQKMTQDLKVSEDLKFPDEEIQIGFDQSENYFCNENFIVVKLENLPYENPFVMKKINPELKEKIDDFVGKILEKCRRNFHKNLSVFFENQIRIILQYLAIYGLYRNVQFEEYGCPNFRFYPLESGNLRKKIGLVVSGEKICAALEESVQNLKGDKQTKFDLDRFANFVKDLATEYFEEKSKSNFLKHFCSRFLAVQICLYFSNIFSQEISAIPFED